MFAKGNRFNHSKVPDVPAPNNYTLDPKSRLDTYQRGVSFEEADRSASKTSDIPVIGLSRTQPHIPEKAVNERYVILQRKVEDLERIHREDKKAHEAQLERMKFDINRFQRLNLEHSERSEKIRKQNELLQHTIQDLKKASISDQSDIKGLRLKLRLSEQERTQLLSKRSEIGDFKKSLQSLESRRKEEIKSCNGKIASLEASLLTEREKNQVAERHIQSLKERLTTKSQEEYDLRQQLHKQDQTLSEALLSSKQAHTESEQRGGHLLEELQQYKDLLARVTDEYGKLAHSTTVSRLSAESQHRQQYLYTIRLERKLANCEGQVLELANLIRHMEEENTFLSHRVSETDEALRFYSQVIRDHSTHNDRDTSCEALSAVVANDFRLHQSILRDIDMEMEKLFSSLYSSLAQKFGHCYEIAIEEIQGLEGIVESGASTLYSALQAKDLALAEYSSAQQRCVDSEIEFAYLRTHSEELEVNLKTLNDTISTLNAEHSMAIQKERNLVHHLSTTIQQTRQAEAALRDNVDQLTSELTDAESYHAAYSSLSEEVAHLISRNTLAEDEAQKLRKFNSEIIGHQNPSQKILYVERVRNELAETKQKLLWTIRQHDSAVAHANSLQEELDMYKSVLVHPDFKPKTAVIRVQRPALIQLNQGKRLQSGSDDITLDESI